MANINWNSYYGIGKGQAGVLQGNPAADDLRQRYLQQQKQKQIDDANFNSQIAKLNFGGAKDADFDHLHNQYSDILATNAQLRATNDVKQRNALSLALQQKQNGLLYDIEKSKEDNQYEHKITDLQHNPNVELDDSFQPNWKDLNQTSSFSPDYINKKQNLEANLFQPKWDSYKEATPIAKGLTNPGKPTVQRTLDPQTGMIHETTSTPQTFDKDAFITAYAQKAMAKKGAIKEAMNVTGEQDPTSAVLGHARQLADTYAAGLDTKTSPDKSMGETLASKMALHQANRLFDQKHPITTSTAGQLTPAQMLVLGNPAQGQQGMLQGNTDAANRFLSLAPKSQYAKGSAPAMTIDPATNEHVYNFPAQVKPDEKAIEANKVIKARYAANPEKAGSILGFGGTPVPIEKSKAALKLKPEFKTVKDPQTYRLDPTDPAKYAGQAEQMANDQNIKLPQLNQILGGRGGRGTVVSPAAPHTTIKVPKDVKLY